MRTIELDYAMRVRIRKWAEGMCDAYARKLKPHGDRVQERRPDDLNDIRQDITAQAIGRAGEVAFCQHFSISPEKLNWWTHREDEGYDIITNKNIRVDIKTARKCKARALLWPLHKVPPTVEDGPDSLVFARCAWEDDDWSAIELVGHTTYDHFLRMAQIADDDHPLLNGTRYIDLKLLDPIR